MSEILPYLAFSRWLKERYGTPVRKISLDAGFGCPNKDGTISRAGCLFCDLNESGPDPEIVAGRSVREQLNDQIEQFRRRHGATHKFLAYLQSGTNTHAPVETLREVYGQAIAHPEVVSLSVSTRPDCAPEPVLDVLHEVAGHLDVWVEFGVQSAHDHTLSAVNRGHDFAAVQDAVARCRRRDFLVCAHLIVGLPGETAADMVETVRRVAGLRVAAVKFHPLCITRGSALERQWSERPFPLLTEDAYVEAVVAMLRELPSGTVVQRISGSGRPEVHIAPDWTRNINRTKNLIAARFEK